ncbi:MAG: site-specific integrase [Deltaproteobacteria bacterium]|nr:site-specific integrase [Deltaproteobacteria bacterium]
MTSHDAAPTLTPQAAAPSFKEVADSYLTDFAASHLKPSTRHSYEAVLRSHLLPQFGALPIDGVDAKRVRELDAEMVRDGARPSTRRNVQVVLRSVLCKFAIEAGFLLEAPRLPRMPKVGRTIITALTREQVTSIIAHALPSHRIPFLLAAYAGLRAGEIRGLRWRDVDMASLRLVVRQSICRGEVAPPKSGHERIVPLVGELRDSLEAVQRGGRDDLVTKGNDGGPWSEFALTAAFKRTCRHAGLDGWSLHDLRHFFVTELFRNSAPAPAVQALAGHAQLSTTQRYAHLAAVDLEAAMRRLGSGQGHTKATAPGEP